jgi:hypothetical protein
MNKIIINLNKQFKKSIKVKLNTELLPHKIQIIQNILNNKAKILILVIHHSVMQINLCLIKNLMNF